MAVTVEFCSSLPSGDPQTSPCRIIGKRANLNKVPFDIISKCLSPRVTEETWKAALQALDHSDKCSLWLNAASVAALPVAASRHNTPSRSHALARIAASVKPEGTEKATYVVVCERSEMFALGCALVRAFPQYSRQSSVKSKPDLKLLASFIIVDAEGGPSSALTDEEVNCLTYCGEGISLTQVIVDTPCNEMHTDAFLKHVQAVGSKLSIKPTIIKGKELDKKGFGGLYGVGKAAAHPPALAVLSHTPDGATNTIAWVGKGIVYDTGGLSIKTKIGMPGMKRDCGGAAGILGAFYAAVKLGFKENLHAVMCLAENAVGPDATRPDDIHTFYSGKTVEVNNTDAEGRLVLGDGVAYARKDLHADVVLDMATLTGAQGISVGKYHGGILTNREDFEQWGFQAGRASGDLVFPLPYCPELHFSEFNSVVADMKNSVADRSNAQSSCAGLFIGSHLGFDYPGAWVHIDMAAPVYSGERATGYGVALLNTLFGCYSSSPLLSSLGPALKCEVVDKEDGEGPPTAKRQKRM